MPQIKRLRIRNLLTYDDPANEDSDWIELGRRTLIVGPNGSGKTNMIRALRLLRAAVDLEEIRPAEVLNYLYDPSKPLAGIDLEVVLSDEEVEAAYDLLRYYVENSIAYLYDFGEHSDELKELLRNVRISMSWTRDKRPTDPSGRMMYGYHELAFPGLHLRLLGSGVGFYIAHEEGIAYESPSSQAEFPVERWADPQAEHACKTKKELLENLLATLEKTPDRAQLGERLDATMRSCAGSKGIVPSQDIHPSVNYAVKDASRRIADIYQMAGISQPAATGYGMGYLLLRIILGGLLFAGSERPLSGLSKLSALRGSFHSSDLVMDENSINEILDEVGASSTPLDAYLRNVEPFLAHLSLSSDHEKKQRFRKISECFSKYFHNAEIDVALESYEVRLQSRPAPPRSEAQSPMGKAWSELSAGSQCLIKLQYPRIYLRERAGGRDIETPIDMAGQGHRELLSLLTALIGRPGSVVFLDEPASNVHPTLLSQFLMDLLGHGECSEELGRDQVIVVTHSPAVAKLFMEADVGASKKNPAGEGLPDTSDLSIIRVYRDGHDGASVIGHLTPNKWPGGEKEFLKTIGRIVDPRVLFARGVVLVEGPADHAFLREVLRLSETPLENSEKWNKLLRNDVELVWLNSKNNIVTYDKVLSNLKIPYVAVLDFDALCEVLLCRKENERKDHPLYKACECEEALITTPGRLSELNDSGELSRYRYVLLLDDDGVPDQLDCNDDRVLSSVQEYCNNNCLNKDGNCKKKKNSGKCELEGFLEGLGMNLSGCTDDDGKLKPESVPECFESQNDEVKGKIKQMGDILFKLINANILGGSTNATASY
ncbi:MAG: AAA family ATPase [Nitrososphaeria archaeon]